MSPRFSIIIPVYNVAPYLRECLDSVLAQTFTDWEAICVDDGSADGSGAILDVYAAKDKRFRVIHQVNAGVSAARNAALDVARGDYICFLDGDDKIAQDWFSVAAKIIVKEMPDLLRLHLSYWDGGEIDEKKILCPGYQIVEQGQVQKWSWQTFTNEGWSVVNFIRRQVICLRRFPVGMRLCEDNVFCLSLVPHLHKVCTCNYRGYFYRARESSAVASGCRAGDFERFVNELVRVSSGRVISGDCAEKAIVRCFCWWCKGVLHECDRSERRIAQVALQSASDAGLFTGYSTRFGLRFGIWLFRQTGSVIVCDVLLAARKQYGRLRRLMTCWRG